MCTEDSIPLSYVPLPPICSETSHKYRWPTAQSREPYLPVEVKTSLDGPVKSSLPEISLRYHRQSTYTDAYHEVKPFHLRGYSLTPNWLDPVGKYGKFYGLSTYEKDYDWPEFSSLMPRMPQKSTIGWGILPLIDANGNEKNIVSEKEVKFDKNEVDVSKDKTKKFPVMKKVNRSKDFVPLQDIWCGEATYRRDYLNPPSGWQTKHREPPVPTLKFSGNIGTSTTAMRDFQDPKLVKHEEYFTKIPVKDKDNDEARTPFFIF